MKRRRYMKALRAYARHGGGRRRRKASWLRRRMIARNRGVRSSYRRERAATRHSRSARNAERARKRFWGTREPATIHLIDDGKKRTTDLAGMGRVPEIRVGASGVKGSPTKALRKSWIGAFSPSGSRIFLFVRGRRIPKKQKWKYIGRVHETHYVPTKGMERMRSFKAGKYWVHQHHDERGRPPKAYMDQAGNVRYGPGTYRIGAWIRK